MGGAIVFPGGKVDPDDSDEAWLPLVTDVRAPQRAGIPFANDDAHLRALAIAACRESLEEAGLVPLVGSSAPVDVGVLRATPQGALREALGAQGLRLDLGALHPFARWVTPSAESRRFDARFFVCVAPEGQIGAHDERETTSSTWATPAELLERFARGSAKLAPPTHRTLSLIASCRSPEDVVALAAASCLDPVQPHLVPQGDTLALTLPGDPEHPIGAVRAPGPSRFVLRGERWEPESAPDGIKGGAPP